MIFLNGVCVENHLLCLDDPFKILIKTETQVKIQRETAFLKTRVSLEELVVAVGAVIQLSVHVSGYSVAVPFRNRRDVWDFATDLTSSFSHSQEVRRGGRGAGLEFRARGLDCGKLLRNGWRITGLFVSGHRMMYDGVGGARFAVLVLWVTPSGTVILRLRHGLLRCKRSL
jgi:hypothetical protein